jgi:hypothetical protein
MPFEMICYKAFDHIEAQLSIFVQLIALLWRFNHTVCARNTSALIAMRIVSRILIKYFRFNCLFVNYLIWNCSQSIDTHSSHAILLQNL